MATDPWGVDDGYWDKWGNWHATTEDTALRIRQVMGADGFDGEEPAPPVQRAIWVVDAGAAAPLLGPCEVVLEDGSQLRAEATLPPDLPIGYHQLNPIGDGETTRLIVTPGRCHVPDELRTWVLAVQLHACRSGRSWGIGDLGDLWRLAVWASVRGAGMVAVNPLHAPRLAGGVEPSPYYSSSRRWRNPLYLQIDEIPGATDDPEIAALAEQARRLSEQRLLDRERVWTLKRAALDRLWARLGPDLRLDRWRADQGHDLETYARFCALADHHGTGWSAWPDEHRHPTRPGVARFAVDQPDRVAFWAWLQLLLDDQLTRAGDGLPLLHDLAIGVDPDGGEAWAYQDLLALDARVGAPPDEFNPEGQDWGLPPFVPWKLREATYEPLVRLWRSALSQGGGLRIDHVMGLFRLFWIPPDDTAAAGAYVRYRSDELLAILAVESTRAGALVVGEDLGTVEDGVRDTLSAAGVLSNRLVWFEAEPPEAFPAQALAAVTTHDLPTVAGVWTGEDLADQRAAGVDVNEARAAQLREKLVSASGCPADAPVEDVVVGVHRRLARAPSYLVQATLEDALAVTQRPNLPGTGAERPNWSLALPMPLDEVLDDPLVNKVAAAMREGRRQITSHVRMFD
ncbi:MAG: 4-alpha-glucanotransferase [Acidimicrobiales bacterium]